MAKRPLLDSDVVIDYLRRYPAAVAFIRSLPERPLISAVTVGELYSGVRDGKEREELKNLVIGFRVVSVTRDIAIQAGLYRRQLRTSHGVELADALIGASAELLNVQLFTLNQKHYPMLTDVFVPYRKP